jgi:peptidoglycan hydrolase-like protein with peptidoglycan-binding domain
MVKESKNVNDVKAYLEAYPRGVFAEAARKRLSELENVRPPPGPPPPPGPSRDRGSPTPTPSPDDNRPALTDASIIREVQERLYNLNYAITTINGRLNDETRQAIREWQGNTRRPQTGDMTMGELAALRNARLPTTWGAIAYAARGASAVVWNRTSRGEAVNAALSDCRSRNNNNDCKVLSAANTACGALGFYTGRVGSTTHWGAYAVVRPTLGQATETALNECRQQAKQPSACGIRITFCADGSHKR